MKTIRFTQSINVSVTIEVSVPEDLNEDEAFDLARDFPTLVTVDVDPYSKDEDITVESISLDGAEVTDAQVW